MNKTTMNLVTEYIVDRVDPDDFEALFADLPTTVRKTYISRNQLKHQPSSNRQHFRNWYRHGISKEAREILLILNIAWWVLVFGANLMVLDILFMDNSKSYLNVLHIIIYNLVANGVLLVLPWSICLIKWRKWKKEHPINLHPYWMAHDYRK